jgi:DNA-binding response OmpR family regulator
MDPDAGILIVEDRTIIAAGLRHVLEDAGLKVAAVAETRAAALELAGTLPLRGAILDVNLSGEPVFPVAEVLRRRVVPFLFLSGYSSAAIPSPWQTVILVEKPFASAALLRALRAAMGGVQGVPPEPRAVTPAIRTSWERIRHARDIITEQRVWMEQRGLSRSAPPAPVPAAQPAGTGADAKGEPSPVVALRPPTGRAAS